MKTSLPHRLDKLSRAPQHASYLEHRKQVIWQVILPVLLAALLLIGLILWVSMATFGGTGDVSRWAAISTIWLVIPFLVAGLIVLIVLLGVSYLLGRLLQITPTYTGIAQDYVFRAAGIIQRITAAVVKPVIYLDGLAANIRAFLRRR